MTEPKNNNHRRTSGLKPEEFLKEEYLQQFLRKSSSQKPSLKEDWQSSTTVCGRGKENTGA